MAPLESVESLGKIVISEAHGKSKWAMKSAEELSKKYIEDASSKAAENAEKILKQGRTIGEKERQKILSTAEMEVKKLVLNAKEALIDEVFEHAIQKFETLKGTENYQKILTSQIASSISELEGKEFVIAACKRDGLKITDDVIKEIETKTGRKGLGLSIEETLEDMGGVIVRVKDGKVSIDNTFRSIFDRKKNEIRVKISEILFE